MIDERVRFARLQVASNDNLTAIAILTCETYHSRRFEPRARVDSALIFVRGDRIAIDAIKNVG
jgi:hypothetical protein